MKTISKATQTTTAFGKELDTPIKYSFSYDSFENIGEVNAAGKKMSDKDVIKYWNAKAQAAARNKALNEALADAGYEKPTLETDEQLRLREMFKVLMSSKKHTEASAREVASTVLGIAWADSDEGDDE